VAKKPVKIGEKTRENKFIEKKIQEICGEINYWEKINY
jgi:hypothetical protein